MSPSPAPAPGCPDDRRKAADVRAELEATVARAAQAFMRQLGQARERLAHVAARQKLWIGRATELAPLADDPRGAFHVQNARILVRLYGALKQQLEIEAAAAQSNLQEAQADGVPDALALKAPDDDPGYHLARRQADYYLAVFLWRTDGEGVDAVLRAAGRAGAIQALDPTEEGELAGRAAALRAAADADEALDRHVVGLAGELAEAERLLGWAAGALKRYEQLDGAGRRTLLGDGDWARLAGKLALLRGLQAKARPWPLLAELFHEPDPVALPFAEPEPPRAPARAVPKASSGLKLP